MIIPVSLRAETLCIYVFPALRAVPAFRVKLTMERSQSAWISRQRVARQDSFPTSPILSSFFLFIYCVCSIFVAIVNVPLLGYLSQIFNFPCPHVTLVFSEYAHVWFRSATQPFPILGRSLGK